MGIKQYLQKKLHEAISNNSSKDIIQAIHLGADVNSCDQPVFLAVSLKKIEALKELIQHNAKVNIPSLALLPKALELSDMETALLLLKNGADFQIKRGNKKDFNYTIMSETIYRIANNYIPKLKGLEFIQELIKYGYEINGDEYWSNALNLIFQNCWNTKLDDFVEILNLFIKNGANPNQIIDTSEIIADSSWTPLLRAIHWGVNYKEKAVMAIKILLDAGANINQKARPVSNLKHLNCDNEVTPLFHAIKIGQKEVINLLIEHGARL